jgi:hypothetical protein
VPCGCACCGGGEGPTSSAALSLAQPVATKIAADAQLQYVLASDVDPATGQITSNGAWGFTWYSPSLKQDIVVTVYATGSPTSSQQSSAGPSGVQLPIPAPVDSAMVFAATNGHRNATATLATLTVYNVASYNLAPGQAVWGIAFNDNSGAYVSASGTYLGNESAATIKASAPARKP